MSTRHILITGSTSGIGFGLAQAFAKRGDSITLNGIADVATVERLRAELHASGATTWFSPADMRKPTEIREMVAGAEAELGSIDVLINNAGIQHVAPVEEFPEEKWDAILAINLSSCFHTIHAVLPSMKRRGIGRIINIASVHGLVASPFKSAYVAAKHGVLGLTKSVALELAETAITCNAICPGYVRTPLVEGQIDQQAAAHGTTRDKVIRDVILAAQPKKEFIEVEDLADLALFLASPSAKAMTGSVLTMDGGWTAR